jgi:hypothetical protein
LVGFVGGTGGRRVSERPPGDLLNKGSSLLLLFAVALLLSILASLGGQRERMGSLL